MAHETRIPRREELDRAECWSTEDLFPSDEAWSRAFEACQSLPGELAAFRGKLGESAQSLYEYLEFNERLDELDSSIDDAATALDNVFKFVEEAFGESQEMLMLVTDLSVSRAGMAFINDHGCDRYFAHNQNLQFYERGSDLAARIDRITLEEE